MIRNLTAVLAAVASLATLNLLGQYHRGTGAELENSNAHDLPSISSVHDDKLQHWIQAINTLPISVNITDPANYVVRRNPTGKLVKKKDLIYRSNNWEWSSSPIVIESHQLVFFPDPSIGMTVFKQLFRRMMGVPVWQNIHPIRYNLKTNGLVYLRDFSVKKANQIMTNPNYTKALFVREPRTRFFIAFWNRAISKQGEFLRPLALGQTKLCCLPSQSPKKCIQQARQSPTDFMEFMERGCKDPHWRPQSHRMEHKYWEYLNFVGHWETATQDTRRLLQMVGAWEEHGTLGWGDHGNQSILDSQIAHQQQEKTILRTVQQWVTPDLEKRLRTYYQDDYLSPFLNLTNTTGELLA